MSATIAEPGVLERAGSTDAFLRTAAGPLRWLLRFARKKPLGFIGLMMLVLLVVMAVLGPTITPFDATKNVARPLLRPGTVDPVTHKHFWFGTDSAGQDVLSRVIQGAQISLVIALTVTLIHLILGTLLGLIAGYFQGPVDYIIQRTGEVWNAFPQFIALLLIVSVLGTPRTTGGNLITIAWDLRNLIFAFSIGAIFGGSRIVRALTLSYKQQDYVVATRSLGAGHMRIMLRHILPNTLPIVIVGATAGVGAVILGEAALSFLGLGVAPGTPSWGQDLSGRNRQYFQHAWWIAVAPGTAISMAVMGVNLFGDALRDILDPRLRGHR